MQTVRVCNVIVPSGALMSQRRMSGHHRAVTLLNRAAKCPLGHLLNPATWILDLQAVAATMTGTGFHYGDEARELGTGAFAETAAGAHTHARRPRG